MGSRLPKRERALFGSLRKTAEEVHVDGDRLVRSVATDLFESLSTPISLSCEILLRYGELKQLLSKRVSPNDYNDVFRFRDDYQAVSFLKKTPFKEPSIDRLASAKEKFLAAEVQCRASNERIRKFLVDPLYVEHDVMQAITLAGRKIQSLLGKFNSREWLVSCRFGPGVFNHPIVRGLSSVYDKLQVNPSVTHDFRELGALLVTSSPPWARSITDVEHDGFWPIIQDNDLACIPGNRVAFVPKTALVDRAIAIEPLLNIYAQLGLGAMMRRRLRRIGIDLNDQSKNQRAALEGSRDGSLATIDLSSASDTVAKMIVPLLFPEEWYHPMDLCRSKSGELDGKWFCYEKFSSMGNGFTFELETLIFWALSSSVCDLLKEDSSRVLVYGDDIVVPSSCYDLLEKVLSFCGFTLNGEKSFKTGVFRESCGKDYYDGYEVRPFFQKEIPQKLSELLALANGLRRLAHRRNCSYGCDDRLRGAWSSAVRAIPAALRRNLLVPAHAGDTDGLVSDWDAAQHSIFIRKGRGWEGWFGLRMQAVPKVRSEPKNLLGGVASLLYRCRDGSQVNGLSSNKVVDVRLLANVVSEFELTPSSPGSPRQERMSTWELRSSAFYGPWTNLGPWV